MSQRSNTIKAAGLYTFLSELQAPEGSLVKADNVNIDEMGVITPRRGFGDYSELPDSQERVKQILNYKKRIIRHYNGFLQYDDGQGNFASYTQTVNEVEPGFRIKSEEVNGNLYFTSSDGIKKISANTSDQLSQVEINDAGVAKAVDLSVKVVPSTLGFLPPQSKVGYKILYGYKDNNNVLVLGSPTSITIATNNSSKTVIPEQFELTFLNITGEDLIDGYTPSNDGGTPTDPSDDMDGTSGTGKYFTVSTINTDYYIWFNLADAESGLSTEQPQDATTFGKIGIQVNVNSDDTPSEIVAKIANILDNDLKDFYDISIKEENTSTLIFTSKEEGDIKEAKEGTVETGNLTINTVQEGKLIPGNNVNCEIETIIPDSIDRNKLPYFIQIYRTETITRPEELQLADISPGDEFNLVYEQAVDLDPRSIFKYTDDTTNDFRKGGTPLYTNPFSGEGAINANERPPIAKDIESFNNYTFYSNTKTFHRSQFRFISVDDFKSEQTSIFIGNEDILRQYIFRGIQEQTEIKCGTKADTLEAVIEENQLQLKDDNINYLVDAAEFQDTSNNLNIDSVVDIFENYVIESFFGNELYFYKTSNNQLVLKNTLTLDTTKEIQLISIHGDYLVLQTSDFSSGINSTAILLYKIEEDVSENITLQFLEIHTPPTDTEFNSLYIYDNKIVVNVTSSLGSPTTPAIMFYEIVNDQLNFVQYFNPTPATTANTIALYENTLIMAGTNTLVYDISDINNPTLVDQIVNSSNSIVATHGNYVLISNITSTGSDSSFSSAGEVIVYKINNNQLNKITTLYSPVQNDNSIFGRSLDIYNNYIIIGSKNGDISFPNKGGAFLFKINSDDSIELVDILTSNDQSLSSDFGNCLGLYNDQIIVASKGSLGTHLFKIEQTEYCPVESTQQFPAFLELHSREDVNKYHLWYDKGTGFDPANIEQTITEIQENSTDNKLEKNNHGLINENIIEYNNVEYFVVNSTTNDFQLSETKNGNSINIQSNNLVNVIKREISKESTGIKVNINTNDTRTEILQSTVSKLNEFLDFNIEAYNSVEGAFGKASTNVFEKENHNLLQGNILSYTNSEGITKLGSVIILSDNEFQLSEINVGSVIDVGTFLENVIQNPFEDKLEKENHGLSNGQSVEYNGIDYIVKNVNNNTFQLENTNKNTVPINGISLESVSVAGNTFQKTMHGLSNNDFVKLINTEDDPSKDGEYFVINATTDDFQLSSTEGGSAEAFTDTSNLVVYTLNETNIPVNDLSVNISISNPFIINVKNSRAGDSTGIVSKNQDQVQINNVQKGKSAYINLYSAEDEVRYYIWFNKGNDIDPLVDQAVGIEVDISNNSIEDTENVALYLRTSLLDNLDFTTNLTIDNQSVIITNNENGNSTDANTISGNISVDIGSEWSININQPGLGEDASINTCKWSINPSISISIEQTARSFVKVVNRDPNSPVNAFYISAEQDIPGLILLENRNLEDKEFYVGVSNTGLIGEAISDEFDPSLPFVNSNKSLNNINNDNGDLVITLPNHDLNVNDEIYFLVTGDQVGDLDQIRNIFKVFEVVDQDNFKIPNPDNLTVINTENTVMYVFKTDQVSENEEKSNRIYYSKLLQPESVPIGNFLDVGSKDQPVERLLALRDTLFILKTDGIYMLTGFGPPFSIRLLDSTSSIIAPDSAVVLNNQIYVLTDDGVAVVTESGISIISRPIEDKILEVTGQNFDFRLKTFATAYDNDKAYIIWLPTSSEDETATQAYRYNYYEKTWTRWTVPATCARVSANSILYIGSGERAVLQKERKNRSRTDYSDRNFTRNIPNFSINNNTIRLSSFTDVEIGDVLLQDQYVTIDVYNNMLLKLDLDPIVSIKEKSKITTDQVGNTNEPLIEINKLQMADYSDINDDFYILINSANNENKYYIWFNKGTNQDPEVPERVSIKVDIIEEDTKIEIANKLNNAFLGNSDFISEVVDEYYVLIKTTTPNVVDPVQLINNQNIVLENIQTGFLSYINLYSAFDENRYIIWFDRGNATQPLVEGDNIDYIKVNIDTESLTLSPLVSDNTFFTSNKVLQNLDKIIYNDIQYIIEKENNLEIQILTQETDNTLFTSKETLKNGDKIFYNNTEYTVSNLNSNGFNLINNNSKLTLSENIDVLLIGDFTKIKDEENNYLESDVILEVILKVRDSNIVSPYLAQSFSENEKFSLVFNSNTDFVIVTNTEKGKSTDINIEQNLGNNWEAIKQIDGKGGRYFENLFAKAGDNISTKLEQLQTKLNEDGVNSTVLNWIPTSEDLSTKTFAEYIRDTFSQFIDELNGETTNTQYKNYQKAEILVQYESIVFDKNTIRPDLNQITVLTEPRFFEGDLEVYKAIKSEIQWSPLHFGDPSAQKQFSKGTVIVDQNNFTKATVSYSSDLSQGFVDIEKNGKGVGYYGSGSFGNPDLYWGGDGNDVPLLNVIPREKQRGRYLNVKFKHAVAREDYRVLGVTTVVRAVSNRGYK